MHYFHKVATFHMVYIFFYLREFILITFVWWVFTNSTFEFVWMRF